jgi:hypothetical protein
MVAGMIRAQAALMRQAQEFFRAQLVGRYSFDEVRVVGDREEVPADQRREGGMGRYRECVRLVFGPWELFIRSPADEPPLGEVLLIDAGDPARRPVLVSGPLDAGTWMKIGNWIKSPKHQRRIAS